MPIKTPAELEKRVLQFIRKNCLMECGQKVLVAVSGGPDSVCLVQVLFNLREKLGITLHVAHLNHMLRGEEAEADAACVRKLAARLGLPATIEARNVESYRKLHRLTLEEAAREVRYGFLAETARQAGAEKVVVGHTLDDQAETILLHIIRGTGIAGLRGLQPCHNMQFGGQKLAVIRPLLEIKREETAAYCAARGISPCQDSSNFDPSFLRNRVRSELVPILRNYNSNIRETLARLGKIAGDEQAFLETESAEVWSQIVQSEDGTFLLRKLAFKALHPALQRQILRKVIERLLGTLKDIEERHIDEIVKTLDKPTGSSIDLPQGVVFGVEYGAYRLGSAVGKSSLPDLEGVHDVKVPGVTDIPGWRIETEVHDGNCIQPADSFSACLDFDRTGDKIKVRARRPGDRFQPLGMGEVKTVARFMLDARVPRASRKGAPVFFSPQQIIWLAGQRIDDRVKVTPRTLKTLCIRMVRWDERSGKS